MHVGQETKMLRGAICACVLPMILGLFGLGLTLQNSASFISGRAFSDSPHFFTFPIVLCFLIGTPFAALMACVRVGNIMGMESLESWKRVARFGVQSASSVHFWAALIYTFTALMFFFPDGGTMEGAVVQWIWVFIISVIINSVLWLVITLPLSLFCGTIFWRVTKFPE